MRRKLEKALSHLCVVLGLSGLTICVADGINSQMGFLDSALGRGIVIAALTAAALHGVLCVLNGR